jgi:hypothetical protein
MSYIIKKNEPLVNLKLTDTGRKNLSSGRLTFTSFSLGDSEMDYSSDLPDLVNILRPVDKQHDIQYKVPSEGTNFIQPLTIITSNPIEVSSPASERGFFVYDALNYVDNTLCLMGNLTGTTINPTNNSLTLRFNSDSIKNNYDTVLKPGDYIFIKVKTTGYTQTYTQVDVNEITTEPIPYLMYTILSFSGSTTPLQLSGITTGTTFTVDLDRDLPNYNQYTVDATIYPGKDTIKDYFDNETPIAYWDGGLLDFTSNCTLSNDDVPIWNMNIITIEDFIGLDNLIYKGKFNNNSRNYWGTAVSYDYFLTNTLDKVGILHYTNNSVSNFYGEGFYKNTFKLKIPYLMWHKKQFSGVGLGDEIGYTFICDDVINFMGANNDIKYFNLIDQESTPTIVGKVLVDQKIVLIEHPELLAALSIKSNRNWTLPKPKLTLIEPGACVGSSITGSLLANEAIHVSYLLLDTNGISGLHCEDYATVINNSETPKDVVFEFPKDSNNPLYSELSYLRDYLDTTGTGFKTNSIALLWQKTGVNNKPNPSEWNILDVNQFVGTNGCLETIITPYNNFELYTESSIYPSNFFEKTIIVNGNPVGTYGEVYTLTEKQIGEVIVSLNGFILKQATSETNLGIDGDYWVFPSSVIISPNNTSYIKFSNTLLSPGDLIQFHYLRGDANTAATIREDITIPLTGITNSYTYLDGVYLIGATTALTLTKQPNNNVVYVFYNGQLISSNNYGVFTTGTTANRRVELGFTPTNGSQISVLYLDQSGLGTNPIDTLLTTSTISNLRVNINNDLINLSVNSKYDLNDFISLPSISNIGEHTFGDETFFFGNIETDIKATIYKTLFTINVLPNKFISTSNPTFNPNQDKVAFTEIGIYDEDNDLVAIGKFSQPLRRKYNSDMLIIQATIDF